MILNDEQKDGSGHVAGLFAKQVKPTAAERDKNCAISRTRTERTR